MPKATPELSKEDEQLLEKFKISHLLNYFKNNDITEADLFNISKVLRKLGTLQRLKQFKLDNQ